MKQRLLLATCAATAALLLPSTAAWAGSFTISPLRAELSQRVRTAALTVRNEDSHPVVVQVSAMRWEQPGGTDALTPTTDLIVSPAVFTLPPGGSQLLRIALRRAADSASETTYRLLLDEVPGAASAGGTALTVALRLSLPVFVAPLSEPQARLDWQAVASAKGALELLATNTGNVHVQVQELRLTGVDGTALRHAVAGYVLPGATRRWTIDTAKGTATGSRTLRLQAATDQGEFNADLAIAAP